MMVSLFLVSVVLALWVALISDNGVSAFSTMLPRRHNHCLIASRASSILAAKRVPRSSSSFTRGARGPKSSSSRNRQRRQGTTVQRRAPHQFDHTKEEARPFVNPLEEIRQQSPNEDSEPYKLPAAAVSDSVVEHVHVETVSLDELFPGLDFSHTFATSTAFRTELRNAMREDVFDTTPAYHGMSDKARTVLLLPDSSLQGSWKCRDGGWVRRPDEEGSNENADRMQKLTQVLQKHLGEDAPSGDDFMDTIGSLCGSSPSTHWIDIVGVLNRRVPHSWQQDTGRSPNGRKTVLLGFQATDNYDGVGVFNHIIKLKREQWAAEGHPPNEPILYTDKVDDKHIMRPRFAEGREIIMYRDVDVLHSPPDVAYRASVMRFM